MDLRRKARSAKGAARKAKGGGGARKVKGAKGKNAPTTGATDNGGRKSKNTPTAKSKKPTAKSNKRKRSDTTGATEIDASPPVFRSRKGTPTWKKGTRIMGRWKGPDYEGEWYEGQIVSVNSRTRMAHVRYDDGCVDFKLKWSHMWLLD